MDDIGKTIIMAGQLLMFIFAITVSVFLYNRLTNNVEEIMLSSNYSNRGDSIFGIEETDTTRTVRGAEVVISILDLKNKVEKTGDEDYAVMVGTDEYTYNSGDYAIYRGLTKIGSFSGDSNRTSLRNNLIGLNGYNYGMSGDETGKILKYYTVTP